MFSRLLVPLDGSQMAESALPIVARLAAAWDAEVLLLHVLERAAPASVHGERHLTRVEDAHAYLDAQAERLREAGIRVTGHAHEVPEGNVARSIVEHAAQEHAELIVLCTHGRGSVREILFGTIAQQVLRRGATPVLLTRQPERDRAPVAFEPRTILVPLDATAEAEAALGPAAWLARRLGACLRLVMVVATPSTMHGERAATATLLPRASQALLELEQEEAHRYLDALAARLAGADLPVSVEVRRGETAPALASEAASPGVGLVVAATHGRGGLQAIWAGSVTAGLLARTRAPVLLLRSVDG